MEQKRYRFCSQQVAFAKHLIAVWRFLQVNSPSASVCGFFPCLLYYVNIVGAVLVLVVVLAVLVEVVKMSGHGIRSISPRFQTLGGFVFVCDCIISQIFDIGNTLIRYLIIVIQFHLI